MRTIDDATQIEILNRLSVGKTLSHIGYNEDGAGYLALHFSDGTKVVLSTLGGIEIEYPGQGD